MKPECESSPSLSDDDRLKRIAEIAELQRQKKDAFRMKLRREVDLQTHAGQSTRPPSRATLTRNSAKESG